MQPSLKEVFVFSPLKMARAVYKTLYIEEETLPSLPFVCSLSTLQLSPQLHRIMCATKQQPELRRKLENKEVSVYHMDGVMPQLSKISEICGCLRNYVFIDKIKL